MRIMVDKPMSNVDRNVRCYKDPVYHGGVSDKYLPLCHVMLQMMYCVLTLEGSGPLGRGALKRHECQVIRSVFFVEAVRPRDCNICRWLRTKNATDWSTFLYHAGCNLAQREYPVLRPPKRPSRNRCLPSRKSLTLS